MTVQTVKRRFAFDWGGCLENNLHLRQLARDLHAAGHEIYLIPAAGETPSEEVYASWMNALQIPFTAINKVLDVGQGSEQIAAGKVAKMKGLGCHILYDDNPWNLAAARAAGLEAVEINGNHPVPRPPELEEAK